MIAALKNTPVPIIDPIVNAVAPVKSSPRTSCLTPVPLPRGRYSVARNAR
jgi:hypothetical protein